MSKFIGIINDPTNKIYKSYTAVAKILKLGQTVTVFVREGSKDFNILVGFGEVSRSKDGKYITYPRHLAQDY